MKKEGHIYVDAGPDWVNSSTSDMANPFESSAWKRISQARYSLRVDLRKNEDALFAAFRKNTQYEIRRAERMGVNVDIPRSDADVHDFLQLYVRVAERKGFAPDVIDHLQDVIRWLRNEEGRGALVLARYRGSIFGGAVIVRAGSRCWYVWGASHQHDDFAVGHLLQWRALLWAKAHACAEYDFGGYTVGATSGPAWFKQGFGGSAVPFVPVHRTILRRARYQLLRMLSRTQ